MEMYEDCYRKEFGEYDYTEFIREQQKLEDASEWIEGVRDMRVIPMENPMSVELRAADPTNTIKKEILLDTADNAGLMVESLQATECLRDCAMPSLLGTAGFSGPGVFRVDKANLAIGITAFLTGSRAESRLLKRAGKVAAVVSKQYEYMPPTELLKICEDLEQQFGRMEFMGGSISHSMTSAKFRFPEATAEITQAYNKVLLAANRPITAEFTPVVEFRTSDTSGASAQLITYLQDSTTSVYCLLPLGEGVKVEHSPSKYTKGVGRHAAISGMEKFKEEASTLYAKTGDDIRTLIPAMLDTPIHYAGNAVIGLCKYIKIPQKWGGLLEEEARDLYGVEGCSFLDVYMLLTEATSYAVQEGFSPQSKRIIDLEEGLSKIARNSACWTKYDNPGTVSWS